MGDFEADFHSSVLSGSLMFCGSLQTTRSFQLQPRVTSCLYSGSTQEDPVMLCKDGKETILVWNVFPLQ